MENFIILCSDTRALVMKVFDYLNNINPEFMLFHFTFKHVTINSRNGPMLKLPKTNSTRMSINSVLFRACSGM